MHLKEFIKNNKTITILILASLLIIINNFFNFFINNSSYQFDPWLSNYQGGFVRRGLPGEIFFQLYQILNINPAFLVFVFVILLYIFFYLFFFKLLKDVKLNKTIIFCLFSPLAFYFPIINSKATGHKEIILLSLLSFFCYILPKISKEKAIYIIIIIACLIGLAYEALIFYLTYFVIAFIISFNFKSLKEFIFYLFPLIFISLILILFNFYFKGTEYHVMEICNSVKLYVNSECQNVGKIADLKLSIEDHTSQKGAWKYGEFSIYQSYFKIYGIGFIFGFLPLIVLYNNYNIIKRTLNFLNINSLFYLFLPIVITFPIYYMGADWGRYLYISNMSSLILVIFFIKNNIFIQTKKINIKNNKIFSKIIFIPLIIVYGFGWSVPVCCEKKFKPGLSSIVTKAFLYYQKIK